MLSVGSNLEEPASQDVDVTMIAVERWLHMSRRSLLTVRRVVILYIIFVVLLIVVVAGRIFSLLYSVNALPLKVHSKLFSSWRS